MKKSLLLGSALLVGLGAFAQSNRKDLGRKLVINHQVKPFEAEGMQTPHAPLKPLANNNIMVTSSTFADSWANGLGMGSEDQVVLSYNADLNVVAFINRMGTGYPSPALDGLFTPTPVGTRRSGYQQLTFSGDNGASWDTTVIWHGHGIRGRYPSGVIVNAPGNTDMNNAYFVGSGPGTDGAAGTGWVGDWVTSATMQAAKDNYVLNTNDQQILWAGDTATQAGRRTYFPTMCATTNGSKYFSMIYKYDGSKVYNVALLTGTRNGSSFVWAQDSVTFTNGWHAASDGSFDFGQPKIAFGPDGMTGYVVISGVSATATGDVAKSMTPNVWKTVDGGTTWNKVNDNYDWKAQHPEILCNLTTTKYDNQWNGSGMLLAYPQFTDHNGGEILVDNTGKLHYFTTITSAYSSHPDSLGYGYGQGGFGHVQYDNLDKPWMWDFTTDGNGTWNSKFISYIYTRNIETTETVATDFNWTSDGAASLDYSNRIKATRSADGTKLFMVWGDSDTTQVDLNTPALPAQPYNTYISNKTPSLFYKGLDVATGNLTPTSEAVYFDAVEDAFYLHQTAEIAMPSAGGFTIPTMYISSADGSKNLSAPVNHNYISDLEILNGTYTIAAPMNVAPVTVCNTLMVGLKDLSNGSITSVSQNFPNPFSGSTEITVNLNKSEVVTINITNAVGQVVATKVVKGSAGANAITIESANLESGIYFYSVIAGNSKVTRKMSVAK